MEEKLCCRMAEFSLPANDDAAKKGAETGAMIKASAAMRALFWRCRKVTAILRTKQQRKPQMEICLLLLAYCKEI